MIDLVDFETARERLNSHIYKTPLEELRFWPDFSRATNRYLTNHYLKLESQQKTRSFKVRGAFNKLISLSDAEKEQGVLAVSSGNHGAAVSYAASLLGIKALIVVPEPTPEAKIKLIKHFGAEVRVTGVDYNEAQQEANRLLEQNSFIYVDPCSDPEVIAGQGTMAFEILEQNPEIKRIIMPVGGGGLITGVGLAARQLKPEIEIIGVQTEACPAMIKSVKENKFYAEYPIRKSNCDALLGGIGEIPFKNSAEAFDEVLAVSELAIKRSLRYIIEEEKVMAEPSAVLGLAVLLEYPGLTLHPLAASKDKLLADQELEEPLPTALIISGANIDRKLLGRLFQEEEFKLWKFPGLE